MCKGEDEEGHRQLQYMRTDDAVVCVAEGALTQVLPKSFHAISENSVRLFLVASILSHMLLFCFYCCCYSLYFGRVSWCPLFVLPMMIIRSAKEEVFDPFPHVLHIVMKF